MNDYKSTYDSELSYDNSDSLAFKIVIDFREYCNKNYLGPITHNAQIQIINNQPVILDPIKNQLMQNFYQKIHEQFQAIIAFELDGQHFVYSLIGFQPPVMMRDKGIWYQIIGSGRLIGLPSIHLIKNILRIKDKPNTEKAIQLAYWTVNHAIEASSGGIGGEITITKFEKNKDGTSYNIENVDATGTKEYINSVYEHIHSFFDKTTTSVEIKKLPTLQNN